MPPPRRSFRHPWASGRKGARPRRTGSRAAAFGAGLLLTLSFSVRAHDWYPPHCCSGQDCYPIDQEDLEPVDGGYFVKATGEFYPRKAVQESPDGKFHRCSIGGRREARTLCLFAPEPAF